MGKIRPIRLERRCLGSMGTVDHLVYLEGVQRLQINVMALCGVKATSPWQMARHLHAPVCQRCARIATYYDWPEGTSNEQT